MFDCCTIRLGRPEWRPYEPTCLVRCTCRRRKKIFSGNGEGKPVAIHCQNAVFIAMMAISGKEFSVCSRQFSVKHFHRQSAKIHRGFGSGGRMAGHLKKFPAICEQVITLIPPTPFSLMAKGEHNRSENPSRYEIETRVCGIKCFTR